MSNLTQLFNESNSADISLEHFDPILGEDTSLFYLDKGDEKIYRLFIEDFVSGQCSIHKVYNELLDPYPNARLEIRICSNGGSMDEGSRLLSMMQGYFSGRVTGYLDPKGYSMGAILFSHCDTRVINPMSTIMYHNYSSFLLGKGGELKDRIDNIEETVEMFMEPVLEQEFITTEEYDRIKDGKDLWLNAEEMCRRGIATHVLVKGRLMLAEDYLKER